MQPDPRKYLWDAARAAELLRQFSAGKSFTDYEDDALLRSAVERQFEIIGEALNQVSKVDARLAAEIPDSDVLSPSATFYPRLRNGRRRSRVAGAE